MAFVHASILCSDMTILYGPLTLVGNTGQVHITPYEL